MHFSAPTEQKRIAVLVLRNDEGKFCLHFRDGTPGIIHPLQWSLFGGHVEPGENAVDAARRELKEEIGVAGAEGDFTCIGTFELPGKSYEIVEYHKAVNWRDIALNEGAGCGFFAPEELAKLQNCSPLAEWLKAPTNG